MIPNVCRADLFDPAASVAVTVISVVPTDLGVSLRREPVTVTVTTEP